MRKPSKKQLRAMIEKELQLWKIDKELSIKALELRIEREFIQAKEDQENWERYLKGRKEQ